MCCVSWLVSFSKILATLLGPPTQILNKSNYNNDIVSH